MLHLATAACYAEVTARLRSWSRPRSSALPSGWSAPGGGYAATEDLPSESEIMPRDKAQALTELLLDRRDARSGQL